MANRIWWMQLHKASLKPTNCIAFNIYSSILKPIFMKGYFQRALPRTMSMISLGYSITDGLYHEGPVDSCSAEEYYKLLASMEVVWNEREKEVFSDQKSHQVEFFSWFLQYKSKEIREHTLRCLREEVGLGSPPKAYYTNDNKSINSLLKESTGYKKNSNRE